MLSALRRGENFYFIDQAAILGVPVMTSAVEELFNFSQYRMLVFASLTADHSTTKPLASWSVGAIHRTSKLLSFSGTAVICLGDDRSKETCVRFKSRTKQMFYFWQLLFEAARSATVPL